VRASEERRIRDIPIIVITGAQDEVTKQRAYACGATDFIVKPIDQVQLLARARAHAKLDQTTRKLHEITDKLDEECAVDPITQLHSRRYLLENGAQFLAYARRHDRPLSLIRLDIDQYADVAARHGEAFAAKLLQWIARILRQSSRTEDTVARLLDSEFVVLAPGTGRVDAAVLCERVRSAVGGKPFAEGGASVPVTVSLGLATLGRDASENFEQLLNAAGEHLTLAKAAGGNRLGVGYHDEIPAPEESVMEQPGLEAALEMLANGEGGKLIPYLPDLLARVLPLLEHGHRNLDLGLALDLDALKEKLGTLK
jgi:diguanylate cyclase (GGDEF)-like protein